MGPEGGDRGGELVITGTPEEVAVYPHSYTGMYIKELLERRSRRRNKGGKATPRRT